MAITRLCSIAGCGKNVKSHGLCSAHYAKLKKYGDPLGSAPPYGKVGPWLEQHATYSGDDCLPWPFAVLPDGYGQAHFRGKCFKASRAMCILAHGEPPSPTHQAAHTCGGGRNGCVNPRHIRWATPTENAQDRFLHGTQRLGEAHPMAKLSGDDVREIRRLLPIVPMRQIAKIFGINRATVANIRDRKIWYHLD